MYIYTKKGEERARALNLDERKAGAQAYCGHKPVTGVTAKAWEKRGYIRAVEQITRNGLKWFYQEFDRPDGQLEAVNLYDENGDFVDEFNSYDDMMIYINRQ